MSLSHPDLPSARASVTELANGRSRVDEYGWLRDISDPLVLQHLEAEETYCETVLKHASPTVEDVFHEICGRISLDEKQVPVPCGPYLYEMRYGEDGEHFVHCRRLKESGREEIILDEGALPVNGQFQVASVIVSPDHKTVLFTVSGPDERCTLYVKSLANAVTLGDEQDAPLRNIRLVATNVSANAAWVDDTCIAYLELDETLRASRLLVADASGPLVTASILYAEPDQRFHLSVRRSESGRFIYMTARTLLTSQTWLLSAKDPDAGLVPLTSREEGIDSYVTDQGSFFYILTNADAPDFKLVRRAIDAGIEAVLERVLDHEPGTRLAYMHAFKRHLVILRRTIAGAQFTVLSGTDLFDIPLPEHHVALHLEENREYDSDVFRFAYDSFVTPYSVIDFDLDARRIFARAKMAVPNHERERYRVDRFMVPASDDCFVPVTLVRPSCEAPTSMPLVLYCYGAYGHSVDPEFSAARLSLLDRGIGYAIVHSRGGGEGGCRWHRDGAGYNKPRAILDIIEAAEHLLREGIAEVNRLAVFGQSAGGLIAAAAVNQEPDLFYAAVLDVPFLDPITTLLDDDHPFTRLDREEWGDPNDVAQLNVLLDYAPYDNVRPVDYPAILLTGGFHDARVGIWEPAKMAARLRALNTAQTPILFHPRLTGGHDMASDQKDELWEWSVIFAFLIQQLKPNAETGK